MLSGAPGETVQKVMTILSAAGFVQQDQRYSTPYYSLHPLTHAYAQTYLRNSGRLATLHDKVRDTVLDYARKHTGTSAADHNALAIEMDNFLATSHWSAEHGDNDTASQIVVALTQAGDFVRGRGYLYELLQLQEIGSSTASPFPANADVPPDTPFAPPEDDLAVDDDIDDDIVETFEEEDEDEAAFTDRPEDVFSPPAVNMNDPDSLRNAIATARGEDDTERALELQEALGQLLRQQGKDNEALATYSELLASYEEIDDKPKMLATLRALAEIMVAGANSQAAVHNATRGAKLAEELGDEAQHAHMLMLAGDARQQLGESTDAILAYSHALDLAKAQENQHLEAEIATKLGFAQLDDDETETAIQTWNNALELCRELDKRDCEGRILGGLGTAYGELQRWEEAISFHTSALHIAREVGDRKEEALQLSNLGYAAKQAGRLPQAVLRYRQALHLAYERDERDDIVSTIVDLGRLLADSPAHLEIAELLINDALGRDGGDREVIKLKERINNEKMMAAAQEVAFKPVNGSAQDYARNAYRLLDE
jgi:tetratricopeptide (TPR) repeat protein